MILIPSRPSRRYSRLCQHTDHTVVPNLGWLGMGMECRVLPEAALGREGRSETRVIERGGVRDMLLVRSSRKGGKCGKGAVYVCLWADVMMGG